MRWTLLTYLMLLVAGLSAQAPNGGDSIYFERSMLVRSMDGDATDVAEVTRIVNPTRRDLLVRWDREVSDLPEGWRSVVCDTNRCHDSDADNAVFLLPARSAAPLVAHVYPGAGGVQVRDEALVTLRASVVGAGSNGAASKDAVATFAFRREAKREDKPSATYRGTALLYPNPNAGEFRLRTEHDLSQIKLTNMLGKTVRTFRADQDVYSVADLPNGIYLVTLLDTNGQVVKTLRLSKRQVMP